mmetsp:Transcript_99396/g.176271  ORF Transcript_99396/g.176271 Transcript_99396/m.176271 type:complete len:449 (-) Transcript_99396:163-1509(-)
MWWPCTCKLPENAKICGVTPECRELAPWHQTGEDFRVLKRVYDALTFQRGPARPRSATSSTSPRALLHLALDEQCQALHPPLQESQKEMLRSVITQELGLLVEGTRHQLVGEPPWQPNENLAKGDRPPPCSVALDSDWSSLSVEGWGSFPLQRLSSIQLEVCWSSFDATLVFGHAQLPPGRRSNASESGSRPHDELEAVRFAFYTLERRLRFVLVIKLLWDVVLKKPAPKRRARRKSKGDISQGNSPTKKRASSSAEGAAAQSAPSTPRRGGSSPSKRRAPSKDGSLERSPFGTPVMERQWSSSSGNSGGGRRSPEPEKGRMSPEPVSRTTLATGVFAHLQGFPEEDDHNGKLVVLEHWVDDASDWHVRLWPEGEVMAVKSENLSIARVPEDEAASCDICIAAPAVMAFVPCGHRCVCAACVEQLSGEHRERCPRCRGAAVNIIRIFI